MDNNLLNCDKIDDLFDFSKHIQTIDYDDMFILSDDDSGRENKRKRRFTFANSNPSGSTEAEGVKRSKTNVDSFQEKKRRTKSSSLYDYDTSNIQYFELDMPLILTPSSISSVTTNLSQQQSHAGQLQEQEQEQRLKEENELSELAVITENYSKILNEKNQRILNLEKKLDEIRNEKTYLKQLLLENFSNLRNTLNDLREA